MNLCICARAEAQYDRLKQSCDHDLPTLHRRVHNAPNDDLLDPHTFSIILLTLSASDWPGPCEPEWYVSPLRLFILLLTLLIYYTVS